MKGIQRLAGSGVGLCILMLLMALGIMTTPARGQDVQDGDLFVGALRSDGHGGAIYRVRGSTVDLFCQPASGEEWGVPTMILTDSLKRVVTLVYLSAGSGAGKNYGLARCSTMGGDPEKLALFQTGTTNLQPGWPVPFLGNIFVGPPNGGPAGLSLANAISVTADDGFNPTISSGDVYQFLIPSVTDAQTELMRFDPDTTLWELPEGNQPGTNPFLPPDMTTGSLSRYYVQGGMLHRTKEPLRLEISGKSNGNFFQLSLSLFGSDGELNNTTLDDLTFDNVDSGCDGSDGYPTDMPLNKGVFNDMDGFFTVVYDSLGFDGLVIASDSVAAGTPYLTSVQETLFDDPSNKSAYFHNSLASCLIVPRVAFSSILPFTDPDPPFGSNLITTTGKSMASTKNGLVGTQDNPGQVIGLNGGTKVSVIATGLPGAIGIAGYPPAGGSAGLVILLRDDSAITSMITDPNGKRIGIDPTTGNFVNDFQTLGFDSGPGDPRIFGIFQAEAGHYTVQSTGSGSGVYTVHAYSASLSQSQGEHVLQSGLTQPGQMSNQDFMLNTDNTITLLDTPTVTLSKTGLRFPRQLVGTTSAAQTVTLTNTGTGGLTVSSIASSGDFAQTNPCSILNPGDSCTISVTFTPTTSGLRTGSVTITDDASNSPQSISLQGTGVLAATLQPANVQFPATTVGTTSNPIAVTLSNNQSVGMKITSIATSGDFAQTNTCGTKLGAHKSCTINVTFTPTTRGVRTGVLTVNDSAPNSRQTASLQGKGR